MLRNIFVFTILSFAGAGYVHAGVVGPADTVIAQIHEVPDVGPLASVPVQPGCGSLNPNDLTDIGWGEIINIGQTVWKIIEAGKPVVNVTTPPEAFALPRGITCWTDLDSWQMPQSKSYEVDYKNLLGMQVVSFRVRLQYIYGGGNDGVGKYLANVSVFPSDLSVSWGYTFNADVETEQPLNLGSSANPMAGLGLNLKWSVSTVMKQNQSSVHFFVRGDGQVQVDQ